MNSARAQLVQAVGPQLVYLDGTRSQLRPHKNGSWTNAYAHALTTR
jgi:hypothetical protein